MIPQILHKKLPSGCGCAVRYFFVFFVLLIFVRIFVIPMYEDWSEKQNRRRDSYQMARIAAFINHERRFNTDEALQEILMRAQWELYMMNTESSSKRWSEIEVLEVPLDKQVGELKHVDYFLVTKSSRIGMLSDGRFIYGPFDWDTVVKGPSVIIPSWW